MKLLLQGSLVETLTLKDLFTGILQAEAPGLSLLRLCIGSAEPYGEIFFLGGHYVVGARLLETEIVAAEALNHLLQLKEADFYYQACDSLEALPAGSSLKIDLKELIDTWQNVTPISSNALLDKIFDKVDSLGETQEIRPSLQPEKPEIEEAKSQKEFKSVYPMLDKSGLGFSASKEETDIDWELVNPLLAGGAPGDNAISRIGGAWEEDINSTQELRSLASGKEWQRKLRDLILILIMLLIALVVILCFAWLTMNSPSSDVNPRRFSVHGPAKKHFVRRASPDKH